MSDTPTPNDAAISVLTERARELDSEIAGHQKCIDVATACRNELLDMVAALSRKSRPRKVRAVTEPACGDPNVVDIVVPPSVFGVPCADSGEAA